METRDDACPEPGEHCLRLAVLEERVAGLARDREEGRRWRTKMEVQMADVVAVIGNLGKAVDERFEAMELTVEKRLREVETAGWRQFWLLGAAVLLSAIGMAAWLTQLMLSHLVGK